jgi:molybdopterin synthase catalytic subunit
VSILGKHAGVHDKGTFSLDKLMKQIKSNDDFSKTGAIGLFIGVVRGEDNDGKPVKKLTLQAYEDKADEVLEEICQDLEQKKGIVDVQIHHLLGDFQVGEDLVYVSVAGSHRAEVFSVMREAVERYKHEAPVFKKEETINKQGTSQKEWVSEKEASHRRAN